MGFFDGLFDIGKSIIGSVVGGIFGDESQEDSNTANYQTLLAQQQFASAEAAIARDFAADQASINRDWLMEGSNSSYQRAVVDLSKAGLNPMLAYRNGGASTPSSSSPSGFSAGIPSSPTMQASGLAAVNTGLAVADAIARIEKTKSEADLNKARVPLTEEETKRTEAQHREVVYRLENILPAEKARIIADAVLKNAETNRAQAQAGTSYAQGRLFGEQADTEPVRRRLFEQQMRESYQRAHLTAAEEARVQMALPGLYNVMRSDLTAYGEAVRPYLTDTQRVLNSAGSIGLKVPRR